MKVAGRDIHKFLVLGGGTLGSRIALQAAISGFSVCIYDIHESAQPRASRSFDRIFSLLGKSNRKLLQNKEAILNRIIWTSDKNKAAQNADFVSESVTENVLLKKKVWKEFNPLFHKNVILTTNTSYLLPSQLAAESGNSANFCAFHFHDVFTARVVDIMPHPETNSWIIEFLYEMGILLNQIPVVIKKETEGYIFNKMFAMNLLTAASIVALGQASIQDVDKSWMGNYNMKIGPFGMMDEVGIDTVWHVTRNMKNENEKQVLSFLQSYIDKGKLGVKTGEGFYVYPKPEFKSPNFLSPANRTTNKTHKNNKL